MRRIAAVIAATLLPLAAVFATDITLAIADDNDGAQLNPCAVPNEIVGSFEETAWRIWVAATCPVNNNQYPYVVWENWIEQGQLYPTDPSQGLKVPNSGATTAVHVLHSSPLTLSRHPESLQQGLLGAPNTNCNAANAPPPPNTAPPDNSNPLTICEEVREGGTTEDYIAGTGLWNRANQAAAATDSFDIQFPRPAVEIKADWIQVSTIGNHNFNCSNIGQTGLIHVETVDGSCGLRGTDEINRRGSATVSRVHNLFHCVGRGVVDRCYGPHLAGLRALLRINVCDDHLPCYCSWCHMHGATANPARANDHQMVVSAQMPARLLER